MMDTVDSRLSENFLNPEQQRVNCSEPGFSTATKQSAFDFLGGDLAEMQEVNILRRSSHKQNPDEVERVIHQRCVEALQNKKNPVKLVWENLNYEVTLKDGERKKILNNCTGYALPGQTLYIMGASGAGKTSLMNAISDRILVKKDSSLTGLIEINDEHKMSPALFGNCGVYVMQDDVLFENFTVKEAFQFAAKLKLKCSPQEQE
jgi:ABC-type multidrug transport system fused ATPase/permease subunit